MQYVIAPKFDVRAKTACHKAIALIYWVAIAFYFSWFELILHWK
ncbi:MAG: hypothetical protein ACKPEQ_04385 [Dolichospermum sp.]